MPEPSIRLVLWLGMEPALPKTPLKQKIGSRLQKHKDSHDQQKLSPRPLPPLQKLDCQDPKGLNLKLAPVKKFLKKRMLRKHTLAEVAKTAEATPSSPQREYLTTPSTAQQFKEDQLQEKNSLANVEFEVAEGFADGGNIPPDPQKAREYYQRAAEKATHSPSTDLAWNTSHPLEQKPLTPQNAVVWLERAAAQGHADSQHQLGEIYLAVC